jgi:cellobiose-specific phosphotransferase system component IIC
MSNRKNTAMQDYYLISRVAHVVERSALAMAGAMCGTFVAVQMMKAHVALFESVGFVSSMVLIGVIGFYLGIDIPRLPAGQRPKVDPVELLSATGTFLAVIAALVSVYAIVFDEVSRRVWELVIGSWWVLGITMQISAGVIRRWRRGAHAVVRVTTDRSHGG